MTRIVVTVHIPAPPKAVWDVIERIEDHVTWMADARSIEFLGPGHRGVGTRIAVRTRIGPLRTTDIMEFTEWSEPRTMGVTHRGAFVGTGRFLIEPEPEGSRFSWIEDVVFPWYLGGPIGARIARPLLVRVWRQNLGRLAARFSVP